jgi:hypothetical protein
VPVHGGWQQQLRAAGWFAASAVGAWLLGAQFDSDAPNVVGASILVVGAVGFGGTLGRSRAWLFPLVWAAHALALGVVSGYEQPAAGWRALMALLAGGPIALAAGAAVSRRARSRARAA